jgi:hypothetical protein
MNANGPGSDQQGSEKVEEVLLTPAQQKSQSRRNIAIALAIGVFILLIYLVTIAKLGPGVLDRPL